MVAVGFLLLGIWLARGRLREPGQKFTVAAIGYAVIRFSLTFYRQEAIVAWGLQEAQLFALATSLLTAVAFAIHWRRTDQQVSSLTETA